MIQFLNRTIRVAQFLLFGFVWAFDFIGFVRTTCIPNWDMFKLDTNVFVTCPCFVFWNWRKSSSKLKQSGVSPSMSEWVWTFNRVYELCCYV